MRAAGLAVQLRVCNPALLLTCLENRSAHTIALRANYKQTFWKKLTSTSNYLSKRLQKLPLLTWPQPRCTQPRTCCDSDLHAVFWIVAVWNVKKQKINFCYHRAEKNNYTAMLQWSMITEWVSTSKENRQPRQKLSHWHKKRNTHIWQLGICCIHVNQLKLFSHLPNEVLNQMHIWTANLCLKTYLIPNYHMKQMCLFFAGIF